jgi:hypothetical protein
VDRHEPDVDCLGKAGMLSTRPPSGTPAVWHSLPFSMGLPQTEGQLKSLVGLPYVRDRRCFHPHIHNPYYDYVFLTSRNIGSTKR